MCWLLISHETTRKKSPWAKLRLLDLCMNSKCLSHSPRVPNEGIIKVSYKVLGPGLRDFEAGLIRSNGQCVSHALANISQYLLEHRLLGAPPVLWFSTFVGVESDIWISNSFPWSGPRLENHYQYIINVYAFCQFSQAGSHVQVFYHLNVDRATLAGLWLTRFYNPHGSIILFFLLKRAFLIWESKVKPWSLILIPSLSIYVKFCRLRNLYIIC